MATWSAADNQLLDQLVAESADIVTMQKKLGKTQDSIRHKLKRMGVKVTKAPKSPKPIKLLKEKPPKKVRVKKSAPAAEEDNDAPAKVRVYPIDRIGPRGCRWPMGDYHPTHPDFHFCGAPVKEEGKPYCKEHSQRAFGSGQPIRVPERV